VSRGKDRSESGARLRGAGMFSSSELKLIPAKKGPCFGTWDTGGSPPKNGQRRQATNTFCIKMGTQCCEVGEQFPTQKIMQSRSPAEKLERIL